MSEVVLRSANVVSHVEEVGVVVGRTEKFCVSFGLDR